MRHPFSRRPRGFSLVEIAMVLAIGALIISGAMLFYQNANMSLLANETQTEMTVIVSAVHNMYSGVSDYTGLDDTVMYNSPLIPTKWKSPSGTLTSPYRVVITMVSLSGDMFFVVLHDVPKVVCSRLVSSDPGQGSWWIVGGGVPVYSSPVGAAMTPAQTNAACGYPMGSGADIAYAVR